MSDTFSAGFTLITDDAPVTLGDLVFQYFEVPERVTSGGAHTMKVHRFPGDPGGGQAGDEGEAERGLLRLLAEGGLDQRRSRNWDRQSHRSRLTVATMYQYGTPDTRSPRP